MTRRRITTAAGFALLLFATLLVAEATLGALLVLFSLMLRVNLTVELAPLALGNTWMPRLARNPDVTFYAGAVLASIGFTAACGLGAGVRRFLVWRPMA